MPELPDVERYRRRLAAHGTGREIRGVSVTDAGVLRNTTSRQLGRALEGRRFGDPRRHGKWLIAPTTGPIVLLHFGMTGDLICAPGGEGRHRHDRVVFALDHGEIRFRMMRKLGGLWLADEPQDVDRTLGHLGPDALEITRDRFLDLLARRRGRVKAALLDQRLVAGVGNILADEALWRARLHPATRIYEMPESKRDRLHAALQGVLREAVDEEGIEWGPGWLARVRDRPGARCPRCRATLVRASVGGRTAVLCPRCQPGPGR